MTNTRITDPEILEKRFPIILRQFGIRPNSGGLGQYNGGNGVIRELEFRRELVVSMLSERRSFQPYGLNGGQPGERGLNLLYINIAESDNKIYEHTINLGGKNTVSVKSGSRLKILTPGGGGYGPPYLKSDEYLINSNNSYSRMNSGSLNQYIMNQESV